MQDKHYAGEGARVDAVVNAESGLGAFSDGVFGGGDGDSDIIIIGGRIGGVGGEVLALDTNDAVVGGVVLLLAGLE